MISSVISSADKEDGQLQWQAAMSEGGATTFRKWVSLTCDSNQFNINSDSVRCEYSTAEFMSTVDGDAVIVVPAAFRFPSQMVAHAVLPSSRDFVDSGRFKLVDIAFRRSMVRCDRQYQFAYVNGHRYDVMGVSEVFIFVHGDNGDGHCDCSCDENDTREGITTAEDEYCSAMSAAGNSVTSTSAASIIGEDFDVKPQFMVMSVSGDNPTVPIVTMSSLISSLMDIRSSTSQCSVCRIPSNHRQVLDYLTKHIDRLSEVDSNIDRERLKQTECLDNCTALLEYLYIKKKMLTQEMENCRRFVDGLISCLLKNRKAIFQTRGNMVFVKIDETHDHECSVIERFMISIINKQKNTIENLMTIHEEVNTMVNMMQLFAIVL